MNRRRILMLIAASGLLFPVGCETLAPQHRASSLESAASMKFAVLMVKRFDDYKKDLQPKFGLTEADALNKVAPDTLHTQDALYMKFKAELELARAKGGAQKPTAPTADDGSVPAKAAADTLAADTTFANKPEKDAVLQYLAATALFQEVKLLETYINDAAIGEGEAYIVRLQLSVMPRKRYQPYDLYTTISAIPIKEKQQKRSSESGVNNPGPASPSVMSNSAADSGALDLGAPVTFIDLEPNQPTDNGGVRLIPLLVTDNLEAALRQSSRDQVLDLAVAASVASPAISAGGGAGLGIDKLQRVLARDYNSLYTVGRSGESSVQVRFGAPSIGVEEYAMTARTQNISFLVIAPKGKDIKQILFTSKSTAVDAKTGQALDSDSRVSQIAELDQSLEKYLGREKVCLQDKLTLMDSAGRGQLDTFKTCLKRHLTLDTPSGKDTLARLWVDCIEINSHDQYAQAHADLPPAREPTYLSQDTIVPVLADDGKKCTLVLGGGRDLDSAPLAAQLQVGNDTNLIPASTCSVIQDSRSRALSIEFPSLRLLRLTSADSPPPTLKISVRKLADETYSEIVSRACRYAFMSDDKPEPFKISTSYTAIKLDKGESTATVALTISPKFSKDAAGTVIAPSGPLTIQVQNAGVDAAGAGKLAVFDKGVLTLAPPNPLTNEPYSFVLKLTDLKDKAEIKLTPMFKGEAFGAALTIPVSIAGGGVNGGEEGGASPKPGPKGN